MRCSVIAILLLIPVRALIADPWKAGDKGSAQPPDMPAVSKLNVPPEGFTALFNGKDLTGWRVHPKVKEMWSIEDGVLKSHGLLEQWGADLVTEKEYRDFVLMLDFRMPAISDSGIMFRRIIPEIPNFGDQEQFNLRSRGGMGHLESFYFLPHGIARRMKLTEEQEPKVPHIDPEVGVWHTVKLTMQGRTLSAEYDGHVLYDRFTYPDWMMSLEPAPIRLQKHVFVSGEGLGQRNPCPIEFRNIFIKVLDPSDPTAAVRLPSQQDGRREGQANQPLMKSRDAELLDRIDKTELPPDYDPAKHQEYVDQHWPKLSPEQVKRVIQLWKLKQEIDPDMPNRGFSFVKIMTYVAKGEPLPAENDKQKTPSMNDRAKAHKGKSPESRSSRPVHGWNWSAATDEQGTPRKASPLEIPKGPTIDVVSFGLLEDDHPPVVLLPDSCLSVTGRLLVPHPVYFGVTVRHPNGDFAGRFVTMRPADEFQSGKDFQVTLDYQDFQLDRSLADMKDKLPSTPFHFVVESIWFTTLENAAGLEITELRLVPPTQEESD